MYMRVYVYAIYMHTRAVVWMRTCDMCARLGERAARQGGLSPPRQRRPPRPATPQYELSARAAQTTPPRSTAASLAEGETSPLAEGWGERFRANEPSPVGFLMFVLIFRGPRQETCVCSTFTTTGFRGRVSHVVFRLLLR